MKRIKKNLKRYIAFLAVLIILVSITVPPAHASIISHSARQRFAAGIASALLGLQITLQSTLAPYQQLLDTVGEPLNTAIEYTFPESNWEDDILDRSVIEIWDDYVEIDGIKYTDIWLSTSAAERFRVNAFDFKTGYYIASNTSGTYAEGTGYYDNLPVYNVNGQLRTQNIEVPTYGTYTISNHYNAQINDQNTVNQARYQYNSGNWSNLGTFPKSNFFPTNWYFYKNNNAWRYNWSRNSGSNISDSSADANLYVAQPFDFDYVSGTIPADQQLPDGTGMMIRVPSDSLDDFYDAHPNFTINAPVNIDFQLNPSLKAQIDDLFDVLIPVLANLEVGDINFIENHSSPAPIQDTLLPDTWWSTVSNKFDQIINAIENFSLQPVIQAIQTIPSTIQTIGGNIIQSISDLGDTILRDIEQGPIKVIDKALDKLKSIFLPILANLRSALGIWHYVVEWVNGISAPLTWIFGIVQGSMSFIMVPIYATIAGWIVIMVYKRFGR